MPPPPTGRRGALFDRAQADWRRHRVFPGARRRRRAAPSGGEGIHGRHRGASLRGADVTESVSIRNRSVMSAARKLPLTTRLGQIILSVTDKFFCPYERPTPRHHRRPRARAGGSPTDSVAAPSPARAAAIGAAARESDGDAAPAGAVPPAEARVAAAGGGARARTCWPAHRSFLRSHRN